MNVSLTPRLAKMVQRKVASGRYNSASEVIREALRLLEDRDLLAKMRQADLRKQVAIGVQQLDRGESVEYTDPAELLARIKSDGRTQRTRHTPRRGR